MFRSISFSLVLAPAMLLAAVPSGAGAQYRNARSARGGALVVPHLPPTIATLAVRYGGDLQLSQQQLDSIQVVRQRQDSANAPWLRSLDSLRNGPRPVNPLDLSPEQREQLTARRASVEAAMNAMRATNEEARRQVMAMLTPGQQQKAAQLETDAEKLARAETQRRADEGNYRRGGMYDQQQFLTEG